MRGNFSLRLFPGQFFEEDMEVELKIKEPAQRRVNRINIVLCWHLADTLFPFCENLIEFWGCYRWKLN